MQAELKSIPADPLAPAEESTQRYLAATEISPNTAKFLSLGFIVILCLPGLIQLLYEIQKRAVFSEFRNARLTVDGKGLRALERSIEDNSICKTFIQPRIQLALTALGRVGNEKVTVGKDGWLYPTDGLRFSFGRPFLEKAVLERKSRTMIDNNIVSNPSANPMPALAQLADDCRRWGIRLTVVPLPEKGAANSQHLGPSYPYTTLLNPDFKKIVAELRSRGVEVLFPECFNQRDTYQYLRNDTHWAPALMQQTAAEIANLLEKQGAKAIGPSPFKLIHRQVTNMGDLVRTLGLVRSQALFLPQTVDITQVVDKASGDLLQPDARSDVLMLGDSYTNIYSSTDLHWGESAGLSEHVAYLLNKSVDVIAINGSASSGVRYELARGAQNGRLDTKKWIVYEFGMRTLSDDDWPVLPFGPPSPTRNRRAPTVQTTMANKPEPRPAPQPVSTLHQIVLSGRLVMLSRPIDPEIAPYPDGLVYGKMSVDSVISGSYSQREAIIVFWTMKAHKLLPAAMHRVGDRVTLQLIPFSETRKSIHSMQRSDDTQDFDLVPLFVVGEQ